MLLTHRRRPANRSHAIALLVVAGVGICGACSGPSGRQVTQQAPEPRSGADTLHYVATPYDLEQLDRHDCRLLSDTDSILRARVLRVYRSGTGSQCIYKVDHSIEGEPIRHYFLVEDGAGAVVRDHPRDSGGRGLVDPIGSCELGQPPEEAAGCPTASSCVRLVCWAAGSPRFLFVL
jgi:hypothetical protein